MEDDALSKRLSRALLRVSGKLASQQSGTLVQVWVPRSREDNAFTLSCQGLPFAVFGVEDLLTLFRFASTRYNFTTDSSQPHLMGAIGRVFSSLQPEMTQHLQKLDKEVYLRVGEAQHCSVESTLVLPLFKSESRKEPVAVFELVKSDKDINFAEVIEKLSQCLKEVKLYTTESYHVPKRDLSLYRMDPLVDFRQQKRSAEEWIKFEEEKADTFRKAGIAKQIVQDAQMGLSLRISDPFNEGKVGVRPIVRAPYCPAGPSHPNRGSVLLDVHKSNATNSSSSAIITELNDNADKPSATPDQVQPKERPVESGKVKAVESEVVPEEGLTGEARMESNMVVEGNVEEAFSENESEFGSSSSDVDELEDNDGGSERGGGAHGRKGHSRRAGAKPDGSGAGQNQADKSGGLDAESDKGHEDHSTKRAAASARSTQYGADALQDASTGPYQNRSSGGAGKRLSYNDLQSQFQFGLKRAAKNLGLCTTTLKRACRRHGIKQWPRRQIAKLSRALTEVSYGGLPPPKLVQTLAATQVLSLDKSDATAPGTFLLGPAGTSLMLGSKTAQDGSSSLYFMSGDGGTARAVYSFNAAPNSHATPSSANAAAGKQTAAESNKNASASQKASLSEASNNNNNSNQRSRAPHAASLPHTAPATVAGLPERRAPVPFVSQSIPMAGLTRDTAQAMGSAVLQGGGTSSQIKCLDLDKDQQLKKELHSPPFRGFAHATGTAADIQASVTSPAFPGRQGFAARQSVAPPGQEPLVVSSTLNLDTPKGGVDTLQDKAKLLFSSRINYSATVLQPSAPRTNKDPVPAKVGPGVFDQRETSFDAFPTRPAAIGPDSGHDLDIDSLLAGVSTDMLRGLALPFLDVNGFPVDPLGSNAPPDDARALQMQNTAECQGGVFSEERQRDMQYRLKLAELRQLEFLRTHKDALRRGESHSNQQEQQARSRLSLSESQPAASASPSVMEPSIWQSQGVQNASNESVKYLGSRSRDEGRNVGNANLSSDDLFRLLGIDRSEDKLTSSDDIEGGLKQGVGSGSASQLKAVQRLNESLVVSGSMVSLRSQLQSPSGSLSGSFPDLASVSADRPTSASRLRSLDSDPAFQGGSFPSGDTSLFAAAFPSLGADDDTQFMDFCDLLCANEKGDGFSSASGDLTGLGPSPGQQFLALEGKGQQQEQKQSARSGRDGDNGKGTDMCHVTVLDRVRSSSRLTEGAGRAVNPFANVEAGPTSSLRGGVKMLDSAPGDLTGSSSMDAIKGETQNHYHHHLSSRVAKSLSSPGDINLHQQTPATGGRLASVSGAGCAAALWGQVDANTPILHAERGERATADLPVTPCLKPQPRSFGHSAPNSGSGNSSISSVSSSSVSSNSVSRGGRSSPLVATAATGGRGHRVEKHAVSHCHAEVAQQAPGAANGAGGYPHQKKKKQCHEERTWGSGEVVVRGDGETDLPDEGPADDLLTLRTPSKSPSPAFTSPGERGSDPKATTARLSGSGSLSPPGWLFAGAFKAAPNGDRQRSMPQGSEQEFARVVTGRRSVEDSFRLNEELAGRHSKGNDRDVSAPGDISIEALFDARDSADMSRKILGFPLDATSFHPGLQPQGHFMDRNEVPTTKRQVTQQGFGQGLGQGFEGEVFGKNSEAEIPSKFHSLQDAQYLGLFSSNRNNINERQTNANLPLSTLEKGALLFKQGSLQAFGGAPFFLDLAQQDQPQEQQQQQRRPSVTSMPPLGLYPELSSLSHQQEQQLQQRARLQLRQGMTSPNSEAHMEPGQIQSREGWTSPSLLVGESGGHGSSPVELSGSWLTAQQQQQHQAYTARQSVMGSSYGVRPGPSSYQPDALGRGIPEPFAGSFPTRQHRLMLHQQVQQQQHQQVPMMSRQAAGPGLTSVMQETSVASLAMQMHGAFETPGEGSDGASLYGGGRGPPQGAQCGSQASASSGPFNSNNLSDPGLYLKGMPSNTAFSQLLSSLEGPWPQPGAQAQAVAGLRDGEAETRSLHTHAGGTSGWGGQDLGLGSGLPSSNTFPAALARASEMAGQGGGGPIIGFSPHSGASLSQVMMNPEDRRNPISSGNPRGVVGIQGVESYSIAGGHNITTYSVGVNRMPPFPSSGQGELFYRHAPLIAASACPVPASFGGIGQMGEPFSSKNQMSRAGLDGAGLYDTSLMSSNYSSSSLAGLGDNGNNGNNGNGDHDNNSEIWSALLSGWTNDGS